VLYIFESEPSFVAELNQSLRVIETILRYMVVGYEDDINKLKTDLAAEAKQTTPGSDEGSGDATVSD
jgi:ribosomal protein S6